MALQHLPDDLELLLARASALLGRGRLIEARDACLHAEALGLGNATLYLKLGWSCYRTGELTQAEIWMRKAVAADPGALEARHGQSEVLMARQRIDEAAATCEATLKRWREDFYSLSWLGQCRLRQGDPIAAEDYLKRAISANAEAASTWINLSASLAFQSRSASATQALDEAQRLGALGDENAERFADIAIGRLSLGQVEAALQICEENLAQRPSVDGHRVYAQALLSAGRIAEGWHHYEFRWLKEPYLSFRPGGGKPVWTGQDLQGKTIVLRVEQGYGDAIQFLRYAPHLKALGATVLLDVFKPIKQLAATCPGIDRAVTRDESLPAFDFYVHLLSLPRVFGTDLESIPCKVPYLAAEAGRVARWMPRIGGLDGLRIGLVWAGSPEHPRDRQRSMAVSDLRPLLEVEGARFFSLQKDPKPDRSLAPAVDTRLVDLGPELEDFTDTAAVISQLDLVICVDTAVAHLAGALAKPVWLMIAADPDWRWMLECEDSPWYPTMRLFRQRRMGNWKDVVEQVKVSLQHCVQRGSVETASSASRPKQGGLLLPRPTLARLSCGHKSGFSAVAETRVGIVQYFPDEPLVGDSISWYGEYRQPQIDLLGRLIQSGATIIEVGAGVGMQTLYLAAAIGPSGHLFVYEPRPRMQRVLRQNLMANRLRNVTLMTRALGPAAEAATTESIDELRLEQLRLLKIDAGVAALDVLAGAADTLWRLRPLLFIGARDEADVGELTTDLKDFSYRCWRMTTPLFHPDNFNRRQDDIFAGCDVHAVLGLPEELDVDLSLSGLVEIV